MRLARVSETEGYSGIFPQDKYTNIFPKSAWLINILLLSNENEINYIYCIL